MSRPFAYNTQQYNDYVKSTKQKRIMGCSGSILPKGKKGESGRGISYRRPRRDAPGTDLEAGARQKLLKNLPVRPFKGCIFLADFC
jgi:hypothetical protein